MEKQNRLGTAPVGKLMLSMGIPMILSMMLQAVYNIVDSAFVGAIPEKGQMALNALTLAFPVQMLMVAVGIGTGVGMGALLSRSLGQGNNEKAGQTIGNGIFLSIIIYLVFAVFGIWGVEPYVLSQTSNPEIAGMAVSYLRICCVVSVGIVFFPVFEKGLQATGRSMLSTTAQITGAVANIILDPIFIFGYCGLPEMGVEGAAIATVIGQIISAVMGLILHLKKNVEVPNRLAFLKPSGKIIKEIYSIGLPAIIAQALMSFMTYGLNIIIGSIGESAVTAYGMYYKVQQFILFAAFGLRDAITPIVAFNHGMQSKSRIFDGIKYGLIYTTVIMAAGTVLLEVFADPLASFFGLTDVTRSQFNLAMRVISISFIFAGINIALQGVFQALDSGLESLIISVCRQTLFVLPVAWGFAQIAKNSPDKLYLVWLTFIIAEFLSAIISVIFMIRIKQRKIQNLGVK